MAMIKADPNYRWVGGDQIRELAQDDGSDNILDRVDVTNRKLLNKMHWLYTNRLPQVVSIYDLSVNGILNGLPTAFGDIIPARAVALFGVLEVTQAITGDNPAVNFYISLESPGDVVPLTPATILAPSFWATSLNWDITFGSIKVTEDRQLTITAEGGVLISGAFRAHLIYVHSV